MKNKTEELNHQQKLLVGVIDFTAGSLAGALQVYVSQPLDTVKVKQQTFPKLYKNMVTCFLQTYRTDGIARGLFAGTVPAVVASVAENSVLFAAYGGCQKLVAYVTNVDHTRELNTIGNAFAGCLASFFSTFALCPTELVKCKMQAFRETENIKKTSKMCDVTPWKITRHIYRTEGIRGFYHGLTSTFIREMPGYFVFFGGYEGTRELMKRPDQTKEDVGLFGTMVAGAVGGVLLWITIFPADLIKSRIQVKSIKKSMTTVALNILRKEGFCALYTGLTSSLIRTIPATATLFVVYEYTKTFLENALL